MPCSCGHAGCMADAQDQFRAAVQSSSGQPYGFSTNADYDMVVALRRLADVAERIEKILHEERKRK